MNEKELKRIFEGTNKYRQFMMMYGCAIKEIRTKFEILNDEFSVAYERNPIEMIKSRIKSPESIMNKIHRKGLDFELETILNNINDIAGIRVICSFIDDIYKVVEMFISQDDINVISIKDYIKNPKPNGYRSYHMIVEVPVFFAQSKRNMRVEVQFRTIAMDFWASLEHKMKYKKDIKEAEKVYEQLKDCADVIASTDYKMQQINESIRKLEVEE